MQKACLSYHDYFLHIFNTSTKNPEISHDVQSLLLNIWLNTTTFFY